MQHGARERGKDNHGDWRAVPSSLGLIVVSVPQPAGKAPRAMIWRPSRGYCPSILQECARIGYTGETRFSSIELGQKAQRMATER